MSWQRVERKKRDGKEVIIVEGEWAIPLPPMEEEEAERVRDEISRLFWKAYEEAEKVAWDKEVNYILKVAEILKKEGVDCGNLKIDSQGPYIYVFGNLSPQVLRKLADLGIEVGWGQYCLVIAPTKETLKRIRGERVRELLKKEGE